MTTYKLVTHHATTGTKVQEFVTAELAVAAGQATNPEIDGSMTPNVPDEVLEQFGGVGSDDYFRGFFWLRSNRYAVIFTGPDVEESKPKSGNEYAAEAYAAFHLNQDASAAIAIVRQAQQNVPEMAERWSKLLRTYRRLPVVPSDTPLDDDGDVVEDQPKKLGDMTPAERATTIKNASQRFQAELDVTAPKIAKVMADDMCTTIHAGTGSMCVLNSHGPERKHWDGSITSWTDGVDEGHLVDPAALAEVLANLDLEHAWTTLSYQEQAAEILKRLS